jgi:hypothetical protein
MLDVAVDAEVRQPPHRGATGLVPAEGREELTASCEQRQLPRNDGATAGGLAPDVRRVDDRAGVGPARYACELDPFDVTHHSASHSPAPSPV